MDIARLGKVPMRNTFQRQTESSTAMKLWPRDERRLPFSYAIIIAAFAIPTAGSASSVRAVQLRGLSSVNLLVYVTPHVPSRSDIEARIDREAKEILKVTGNITTPSEDGVHLSIAVQLFDLPRDLRSDYELVQVSVQFIERVALIRDPNLTVPGGAITWSKEFVFVERTEHLGAAIEHQALLQVESFASAVRDANRD